MSKQRRNLVVVSDLHCGCRMGLCHPDGAKLDDGGSYKPSRLQHKLWKLWDEFWTQWVPTVTQGEAYDVVLNGDLVDGVHHGSVTQVSHNLVDQSRIAMAVIGAIPRKGHLYVVRGTPAHGGESGQTEEGIAKAIGAVPNKEGQYARWELWLEVGKGLVHLLHHVGSTGSNHYESTAVNKELMEAYVEAGRWGDRPPDVVVRSHRHRSMEVRVPSALGYAIACVTPGWQAKTPFAYKIPGARQSQPQFGGLVIRQGDEDLYTRFKVWRLDRPEAE